MSMPQDSSRSKRSMNMSLERGSWRDVFLAQGEIPAGPIFCHREMYFSLEWRRLASRGLTQAARFINSSPHQAQYKCFPSRCLHPKLCPSARFRLTSEAHVCVLTTSGRCSSASFAVESPFSWLSYFLLQTVDALALLLFFAFKSPQTVSFPRLCARRQLHHVSFSIFHLFQTSLTLLACRSSTFHCYAHYTLPPSRQLLRIVFSYLEHLSFHQGPERANSFDNTSLG